MKMKNGAAGQWGMKANIKHMAKNEPGVLQRWCNYAKYQGINVQKTPKHETGKRGDKARLLTVSSGGWWKIPGNLWVSVFKAASFQSALFAFVLLASLSLPRKVSLTGLCQPGQAIIAVHSEPDADGFLRTLWEKTGCDCERPQCTGVGKMKAELCDLSGQRLAWNLCEHGYVLVPY